MAKPGVRIAAVFLLLLSAAGCTSNPLLGKWQRASGGDYCNNTLTFTSSQATVNDATPQPGDSVTYTVQDKVVYVSGTARMMGQQASPYNMLDSNHMVWESSRGYKCVYTRVQ